MFKTSGLKAFKDSFILSLIAAPLTALLSMVISYLVVKKRFKGRNFIEFVSMLAMAVPGTVLGIGYIRGYANGLFRSGFMSGLYGTGAILIIVFIVRSLPTGTRSGISALRQLIFQHRAGITPYTSTFVFAECCVFNKQSQPPII